MAVVTLLAYVADAYILATYFWSVVRRMAGRS